MKLPCLYLIDSIVKNLGPPFVELFEANLAENFCSAYTTLVDDKTRREFLRVFALWNGLFSEVVLREIEDRLRLRKSKRSATQAMAKPVSAATTTVAPLHQHHQTVPPVYSPYPVAPLPPVHGGYPHHAYYPSGPPPPPPAAFYHQYPPQPLYQPRLSTALISMLVQLRTILLAPRHAFPPTAIPDIIYRIGAFGELDPQIMRDLDSRCRLPDARPALEILSFLVDSVTTPPPPPPPHVQVPDLSQVIFPNQPQFEVRKMQSDHHFLYGERPKQCKVCGIRFCDDEAGRDAYATHLDSHFRRNMKLRDRSKKVLARDWLQSTDDWTSGTVPGVNEKIVPVFFDEMIKQARDASSSNTIDRDAPNKTESQKIKVGDSERDRQCPMCNEQLKIVFDNDADDWMFVDVVELNGDIYHASCAPVSELDDPIAKKSRSE